MRQRLGSVSYVSEQKNRRFEGSLLQANEQFSKKFKGKMDAHTSRQSEAVGSSP